MGGGGHSFGGSQVKKQDGHLYPAKQCVLRRRRIVTTEKQDCGSAFISSGSGSNPDQGFNDQK
jgi:hypothetical protein